MVEDTFARSMAHWSEDGRAGMEDFYAFARQDYRVLAEALDYGRLFARLRQRRGADLGVLDVACGSGKFGEALRSHATLGDDPVRYALLDPSRFSLAEAARALGPPFVLAETYPCTLQDYDGPAGAYDLVWATHALYALPADELRAGLARFLGALAPWGVGVIAQASSTSHYLRIYDAYLAEPGRTATPFTSSEQIATALTDLGAQPHTLRVSYDADIPAGHPALTGYLQRCLFDDTLTLPDLLAEPALGGYLRGCQTPGGGYRFRQDVDLHLFGLPHEDLAALATGARDLPAA